MTLLSTYVRALRDEPKIRAYVVASFVDDVGVAISGWAGLLLMTKLFTDQRARASVMLPSLVCFLVGALIAGPLADWERAPERVGAYRWKLVIWGRVIETVAFCTVVASTARGLTLSNIMPYMMISAFMKTALGPARAAFLVDLLSEEEVRLDASGEPMRDESGRPLVFKKHLLASEAMVLALRSGSVFVGLLVGGMVVRAVNERYEVLFAFDIATNLVFIVILALTCHPQLSRASVRLRELLVIRPAAHGAVAVVVSGVRHFLTSAREVFAFLRLSALRPLLWIMFGDWLVEVIDEFYSGDMIVKHVLHGSDDALRYAAMAWALASMLALGLVPALARKLGGLGRLFFLALLVDGVVMVLAGQIATRASVGALIPFVAVLTTDRALTTSTSTLSTVAQASASSASMRGRIFAVAPVFAIVGDMIAETVSTPVAEHFGIAPMLRGLGVAQIALALLVFALGGAALWRYGIVAREPATG
jgi:hypothetical protein